MKFTTTTLLQVSIFRCFEHLWLLQNFARLENARYNHKHAGDADQRLEPLFKCRLAQGLVTHLLEQG